MKDCELMSIYRVGSEIGECCEIAKQKIEAVGGKVQKIDNWGRKRLAYEVDGVSEGIYVLTSFAVPEARLEELNASLKGSALRYIVIKRREM